MKYEITYMCRVWGCHWAESVETRDSLKVAKSYVETLKNDSRHAYKDFKINGQPA
jgi:hypothetical protein